MADLEKTVKIIFAGEDQISKTINSIEGGLNSLAGNVQTATQPLADFTDSVLKLDIQLDKYNVFLTACFHRHVHEGPPSPGGMPKNDFFPLYGHHFRYFNKNKFLTIPTNRDTHAITFHGTGRAFRRKIFSFFHLTIHENLLIVNGNISVPAYASCGFRIHSDRSPKRVNG